MKALIIAMIVMASILTTPTLFAADKIDIWGPSSEPSPMEAPAPAPKDEPQKAEPITPKSVVDTVEAVIQKGESLEQQSRRLKGLFD